MMCYFLTNNTEKEYYFPIEIPDEISYDFMTSTSKPTGTPPQTPFVFPGRNTNPGTVSSPVKQPTSFPFIAAPELTVTQSTPIHTPIHTPETSPPSLGKSSSKRGGVPLSCPFSEVSNKPIRKISLESAGTTGTESTSLTHSESDYSIEDGGLEMQSGIQSPPVTTSLINTDTHRFPNILVTQSNSFDTGADRSRSYTQPAGVLSVSKSTPKIHPLLEEDDLHSKSDSSLLRKSRSLSSSDNNDNNTNGISSRETSPNYERNGRSVSEDSFDDSSLPTSPTHGSTLFVRPRSSSLRERINIFDPKAASKRRTGLSTTSYLQSSSLTSFEEDDSTVDNGSGQNGESQSVSSKKISR